MCCVEKKIEKRIRRAIFCESTWSMPETHTSRVGP